jgi:hypothetical protein
MVFLCELLAAYMVDRDRWLVWYGIVDIPFLLVVGFWQRACITYQRRGTLILRALELRIFLVYMRTLSLGLAICM